MDNARDFGVLLDSSCALVLVETAEEERSLALIRLQARERDLPVWTWSTAKGLTRDGGTPQYGTDTIHQALAAIGALPGSGVFVVADGHHALTDPIVVRRVKELTATFDRTKTLVMTAPTHAVPPELTSTAHVWRLRPPGVGELQSLVTRTLQVLEARGFDIRLDESEQQRIVAALSGLSIGQAEHLLHRVTVRDGILHEGDIPALRLAKAQLFTDDGDLELIETETLSLGQIGGLDNLKEWLEVRGRVLMNPAAGLPHPRGLLLTGVPGCGKSLAAKAVAAAWGLPLVLLDPARLFDRYVGGSEEKLRNSLAAIEAMAPAVLWIDEVEKGFSVGSESDGGVTARMLGTFLRWLQEHPPGVFVMATANNVHALPPEFLRRGRFDEIFFVDLPSAQDRAAIIETHLTHRSLDPGEFGIDALAVATAGFSGAEIEAAVVGGMYRSLGGEGNLDHELLLAEINRTVPLSRVRAEDIAALRHWAEGRAVRA